MAVQAIFRSVIFARLLYTSRAWWGFAGAQDRQKVYSFLRRIVRVGWFLFAWFRQFWRLMHPSQWKFNTVLHNPDHVLHRLLPPVAHTS